MAQSGIALVLTLMPRLRRQLTESDGTVVGRAGPPRYLPVRREGPRTSVRDLSPFRPDLNGHSCEVWVGQTRRHFNLVLRSKSPDVSPTPTHILPTTTLVGRLGPRDDPRDGSDGAEVGIPGPTELKRPGIKGTDILPLFPGTDVQDDSSTLLFPFTLDIFLTVDLSWSVYGPHNRVEMFFPPVEPSAKDCDSCRAALHPRRRTRATLET